MKLITLTQGKAAIVDKREYERISQYNWHYHKGYAARTSRENGKKRTIYMHREIMQTPEGFVTDHINGNRLDNRKKNLRICTRAENNMNMRNYKSRKKSKKASKFKGVYWVGGIQAKWVAEIRHNGKQIHLGYFFHEIEAAYAYDQAALELFGEFASPNFTAEDGSKKCMLTTLKPSSQTESGKTQEMIII
ncbi:endonuclease [Pueribacillus theae]|uniref:Endonuclease n=1 Tax=Pueribacillus theae TaxID=2171751 RepID=A0A2U1K1M4_9BACI|nr:HNH endonuclease [Pueribacillus theae]PWA11094.1 endonuclease [Pueribacillus theae]